MDTTGNSRVEYRQQCPRCAARGQDSKGDNLAVYDDGHSYCYSCKFYIPSPTIERLKQARKREMTPPIKPSGDFWWPKDYQRLTDMPNCPGEAIKWLKKYGILASEIDKHRIGWSEEHLLMVFPVFDIDKNLKMWQGRNFQAGPKYITQGPKSDFLHLVGRTDRGLCVVTEDILSAIKVGRVYQAAPLWGADMSLAQIQQAATSFDNLGIWLDPDKTVDAVKLAMRTSQYIPTSVIVSKHDPKVYNEEQITEFVDHHINDQRLYKNTVVTSPSQQVFNDAELAEQKELELSQTLCHICGTENNAIKAVCAIEGCPYFIKADCPAGNTCHERQCGECSAEFGKVCMQEANKDLCKACGGSGKSSKGQDCFPCKGTGVSGVVEHTFNYKKSARGS